MSMQKNFEIAQSIVDWGMVHHVDDGDEFVEFLNNSEEILICGFETVHICPVEIINIIKKHSDITKYIHFPVRVFAWASSKQQWSIASAITSCKMLQTFDHHRNILYCLKKKRQCTGRQISKLVSNCIKTDYVAGFRIIQPVGYITEDQDEYKHLVYHAINLSASQILTHLLLGLTAVKEQWGSCYGHFLIKAIQSNASKNIIQIIFDAFLKTKHMNNHMFLDEMLVAIININDLQLCSQLFAKIGFKINNQSKCLLAARLKYKNNESAARIMEIYQDQQQTIDCNVYTNVEDIENETGDDIKDKETEEVNDEEVEDPDFKYIDDDEDNKIFEMDCNDNEMVQYWEAWDATYDQEDVDDDDAAQKKLNKQQNIDKIGKLTNDDAAKKLLQIKVIKQGIDKMSNFCGYCKKKSKNGKKCSKCRKIIYCGKHCQKRHWLVHKSTCFETN